MVRVVRLDNRLFCSDRLRSKSNCHKNRVNCRVQICAARSMRTQHATARDVAALVRSRVARSSKPPPEQASRAGVEAMRSVILRYCYSTLSRRLVACSMSRLAAVTSIGTLLKAAASSMPIIWPAIASRWAATLLISASIVR